ncbi:MAG: zinc metallopeptidase [Muribaculaceae bacterium]|nr:zinc metallopeptidase [Muribaculaceae bacterium]
MWVYILFIGIALLSYLAQASVKSKFTKYSQIPLDTAMTGKDVAELMLSQNGLNVAVKSTSGELTDHYNPANATVNLSSPVYATNSVAAAAVAAHECGHALQHAHGYAPLKLRTAMVPIVTFASNAVPIVLLVAILLFSIFPFALWIAVALFAVTALFSIITLPVEIDASRRAIKWLKTTGLAQGEKAKIAESALRSAAYTYVVAALSSIATLVYYVLEARR